MSDIVERLHTSAAPTLALLDDGRGLAAVNDAMLEIERLRIRCDGYQASRDWAINQLAATLHVEADTGRAVEFYARLAAEEIERLLVEVASLKGAVGLFLMEDEKAVVAELERLRADLAAAKAVIENIVTSEVEPLKALLREVVIEECYDAYTSGKTNLMNRIRAALGGEPADDAPRKQP